MVWSMKLVLAIVICQVMLVASTNPGEARGALGRLIGQTTSFKRDHLDAAYSTENKEQSRILSIANRTSLTTLNKKFSETNKLITDLPMHAAHHAKLNLNRCTDGVPKELETYRTKAESSLAQCYTNLANKLYSTNTEFFDKANNHVNSELDCAKKTLSDCDAVKGQNNCYQKFLKKVDSIKSKLETVISLYTSAIISASRSLLVTCDDVAFAELASSSTTLTEKVAACIKSNTLSKIGAICK